MPPYFSVTVSLLIDYYAAYHYDAIDTLLILFFAARAHMRLRLRAFML